MAIFHYTVKTVSYTHLDVYKRQPEKDLRHSKRQWKRMCAAEWIWSGRKFSLYWTGKKLWTACLLYTSTFAFALVFAGILSREQIRGQNFFRIIFYIPNILSVVVIAGIFSAIYKPENGMLNSIIGLFHKMENPILWKGESLVIVSLIIAMIWQAIGYYMVMYMASMASVPKSLYESAGLDGAGRLVQFFQITIPLIWTNIRTTLTFFIISTINMAFLFVKAMTSGGPNGASEVSLSYMYGQKDAGLYGYSMAIGVVIFIFSFALSALVNKVTEREPLEF